VVVYDDYTSSYYYYYIIVINEQYWPFLQQYCQMYHGAALYDGTYTGAAVSKTQYQAMLLSQQNLVSSAHTEQNSRLLYHGSSAG